MSEQAAKDDRIPIDRVLIARSGTAELRSVEKYEITRTREALGIPPEAKIVAAIGRMRPEKGMDALVDAVDRITLGGFHLVLVGSGPEEPALKEAASACRHPVHLLGHQSDVALWFHLSDIIAIPSRAESFGRVTVEAMCAGRPIVASRVGGLVEAVEDGATGLLVTPNQPQELANALERLLKDDELRARMGSAARKRFEVRYSMASMAEEWRAVWEQAHRVRSPVGETAA
jgi:glycosyltransferase involved in cell wall biosynthesis